MRRLPGFRFVDTKTDANHRQFVELPAIRARSACAYRGVLIDRCNASAPRGSWLTTWNIRLVCSAPILLRTIVW